VKENANGSINKYNWLQLDSFKCKGLIFSLLVKSVTIRLVFSLAITNQWDLGKLDVNNTFLNDLRNGLFTSLNLLGFNSLILLYYESE